MKGREIRLATGASFPRRICTRGREAEQVCGCRLGVDVRDLLAAS
jgi:hypothetical protein